MISAVALPTRCAVAVVCGEQVVAQVYPASVPIEVFIDDAVELVAGDLKRRGAPCPDPATGYELQRVNGVRLDMTKTLHELGIGDGTALVLAAAGDGEPFEPQCESLSTGLAMVGRKLFPPVTERTAAQAAIGILALVAVVIVGLGGYVRARSDSLLPAVIAGGYGGALALGAVATRRGRPDRPDLVGGFAWVAAPLIALGGAAAAPGRLGSPHLFIASAAGVVLTAAAAAHTRCHPSGPSTAEILCGIGLMVATVGMWRPVPGQWLGMGTLAGLLFLLTAAPTAALWIARVRPPHFGSVTGRDVFSRRDGMPLDAVSPVPGDGGEPAGDEMMADPTPTGAGIAAAALRANGVLTGICLAAASALPVAVWFTVMPGRPGSGAAAALGALFILIFISRARSFADRRQAVALVGGSAAAFCVATARYVLSEPTPAALLWGSLALVGFGTAGLAAALLVPVTPFTPMVRMVTEWLELLAITAALPLAAWVGGLFAWVRLR